MEELTQEYLKTLFVYDPILGNFTRIKTVGRGKVGSIAGSIGRGYVCIQIDRKRYYAHRLAWIYIYGAASEDIDHIDGVRSNNAISNLRLADKTQNSYNTGLMKNNTSGYKGVSYVAARGKYQVGICIQGVQKHLGYYSTAEEASAAYQKAAKELHGEFYKDTTI
jgi:hypothetical protein